MGWSATWDYLIRQLPHQAVHFVMPPFLCTAFPCPFFLSPLLLSLPLPSWALSASCSLFTASLPASSTVSVVFSLLPMSQCLECCHFCGPRYCCHRACRPPSAHLRSEQHQSLHPPFTIFNVPMVTTSVLFPSTASGVFTLSQRPQRFECCHFCGPRYCC